LSNSDAPTPFPEAASQPRAQDSIAPANWIATSASSRRVAAPTLPLARSAGSARRRPRRGSCARLNAGIRGGLSPAEESRDAIRTSQANPSSGPSAFERTKRSQGRIPPCGDRSKPQAPRPLETDEWASGNAGHIAPGWRPRAVAQTTLPTLLPNTASFPIRGNT
jgi:hypothetical protein